MRKIRNKKQNKYLLLSILLVLLSIGFAAFSTTLKTRGLFGIIPTKTKIIWENPKVSSGSVVGDVTIDSQTKTVASFTANLQKPGDYYEFTIDAVNKGQVDAMIDSVTTNFYKVESDEEEEIELPNYIRYSLVYADNVEIAENHLLRKNDYEVYKVRMEIRTDINPTDLPKDPITISTDITIVYKLADDSANERDVNYNIVAFNAGDGSVSETTRKVNIGDSIGDLPIPVRENYDFEGWHLDSPNGNNIDANYKPKHNITLCASWVPVNKVAEINGTYYSSLQEAINAVPTTDTKTTIKLLKNIDENVEIISGKNIELNLRGHTIDSTSTTNVINNSGKLKIHNGVIKSSTAQAIINNNENAVFTVDSGDIIGNNQAVLNSGGNVSILGGNIISTSYQAINNISGELVIGTKDGILNTNSPVIQGNTYGITSQSNYKFYDGIIKGKTESVDNEEKITDIETSKDKIKQVDNIGGLNYKTLRLGKKFIITFNADSGTVSETTREVIEGDEIGELPIATQEHAEFDGWYTSSSSSNKITSSYVPTENMTLYARYNKFKYTVTFDPGDGTVKEKSRQVEFNSSIGRLPEPTLNNYEFNGWYTEKTGGVKVDSTYRIITNTTLYARYNRIKYTVTFNAGNGTVSETTREVLAGDEIGELPTVTQEGYHFNGWWTGLVDGIRIYPTFVPTQDITLYAYWSDTPNRTVIYDANTGNFDGSSSNNVQYTYGDTTVTRYSHTNNIDDDGVSSGSYSNNLDVNDIVTIDNASEINIEVWFSTQNESNDWLAIYPDGITPDSSNYEDATISNGKLGGGRYNYKPYYDSYHKTYTVEDDTAQFFFHSDASSGYYGYYAIITGIGKDFIPVDKYSEPTKTYYDFKGWNTSPDGSGTSYKNQKAVIADMDNLSADQVLYAQWELSTYEISFNSNGGTPNPSSKTINGGDAIGTLPTVTRTDYIFDGWYTGLFDGIEVSTDYIPTSSQTLYARWIRNVAMLKPGPVVNNMMLTMVESNYPNLDDYVDSNFEDFVCYDYDDSYAGKLKCFNEYKGANYYYPHQRENEIEYIRKATSSEYNRIKDTLTEDNIISLAITPSKYNKYHIATSMAGGNYVNYIADDADALPIYMWYDKNTKTIYYYSEESTIYLNSNSRGLFAGLPNLKGIDLSGFDTSKVSDMSFMFNYTNVNNIDFSDFDVSSVTNISGMFSDSLYDSLDLSNWDTSNVVYLNQVFGDDGYYASIKNPHNTINISNWDFSSITSDQKLFGGRNSDFGEYDDDTYNIAKRVIVDNAKFGRYAPSFTMLKNYRDSSSDDHVLDYTQYISLKNVDTSNTIYMDNIFSNTDLVDLDLSSFDTRKVTDMDYMFNDSTELHTIVVGDNWSTNKLNTYYSSYIFGSNHNLVGEKGTVWSSSHTGKDYAHVDGGESNPGYLTQKKDYSIVYDANGGLVSPTMKELNHGEQIGTLPTPTKGESSFVGWYTGLTDGVRVDENYVPNADVTLYARWITAYTITFNPNKGTVDPTSKILIGGFSPIGEMPIPTRKWYKFDGWYMDTYSSARISPSYVPEGSMTVYAHWKLDGWYFSNESSSPSLVNQKWYYYINGISLNSGFHVLPDTYGDNRLYYFSSGYARMGWIKDKDDNWFYFSKSDSDGNGYVDCCAYVDGTYTIDGKEYLFDENGICLNPNQ